MEVNVKIILGVIGAIIFTLLFVGIIGGVFGDAMNQVVPKSGEYVKGMANISFWSGMTFAIIILVIFIISLVNGY